MHKHLDRFADARFNLPHVPVDDPRPLTDGQPVWVVSGPFKQPLDAGRLEYAGFGVWTVKVRGKIVFVLTVVDSSVRVKHAAAH